MAERNDMEIFLFFIWGVALALKPADFLYMLLTKSVSMGTDLICVFAHNMFQMSHVQSPILQETHLREIFPKFNEVDI